MQPIVSGSSIERIVRAVVVLALVDVFTILFLWDGHVGYPRANARDFARLLGEPEMPPPDSRPDVTRSRATSLVDLAERKANLDEALKLLGMPTYRKGSDGYYLGPGGWLTVSFAGNRPVNAAWTDAKHTEADQLWQRRLGYALLAVGVAAMFHVVRVASTRVELSDAGLKLAGKPLIPWNAIIEVKPCGRDGIEVVCIGQPTPTGVRLDPYVCRQLTEIVNAIRARKNLPDPWNNVLRT
ncbi:MAG: hypothetical protein AABZ12_01625 [Planctomycetota bacterium]